MSSSSSSVASTSRPTSTLAQQSTSSSSPSPSSSPTATPIFTQAHASDHRLVILGATLGVIGALLIALIIFLTARFRVGKTADDYDVEPTKTADQGPGPGAWARAARKSMRIRTITPPSPATSRITPFGSPVGERPPPRHAFTHRPGENMRIARRRSDGAWQFSDTRSPFSPSGVSELDADIYHGAPSAAGSCPPSPSSTSSFTHPGPHSPPPRASIKKSPLGGATMGYSMSKEHEVMLSWQAPHRPGLESPMNDSEFVTEEIPPPAYAYDRDISRGDVAPDLPWGTARR
ncbi:hypothetical protein HGRIS_001792 [Hohenbuehelia grisea]|uniref:Uncharacterized protein n=1 Tax=Hohenbuehelia grisea TaxID=104357 RepID=A0ABR3JJR8_9AGAR